jgi:hypothetical protein
MKWAIALSRKNAATVGPIGRSNTSRWASTSVRVAGSQAR